MHLYEHFATYCTKNDLIQSSNNKLAPNARLEDDNRRPARHFQCYGYEYRPKLPIMAVLCISIYEQIL